MSSATDGELTDGNEIVSRMVDLENGSIKHKGGVRGPFTGFAGQAAEVSGGISTH
jgi:hypothetical protein